MIAHKENYRDRPIKNVLISSINQEEERDGGCGVVYRKKREAWEALPGIVRLFMPKPKCFYYDYDDMMRRDVKGVKHAGFCDGLWDASSGKYDHTCRRQVYYAAYSMHLLLRDRKNKA